MLFVAKFRALQYPQLWRRWVGAGTEHIGGKRVENISRLYTNCRTIATEDSKRQREKCFRCLLCRLTGKKLASYSFANCFWFFFWRRSAVITAVNLSWLGGPTAFSVAVLYVAVVAETPVVFVRSCCLSQIY